jgi:serine/threonine protein kinase
VNEERFKYNTQQGDQGLVANPVKGSRELQHNQFALGDIIEGRYQVVSVIGQGGCGCVYQVHQMLLNKQFALKTLNPVHANEVTIMRLQKEGHAASRLEHRNLVRAIDFGMIHGVQPFFVMELIKGPTFADYLKERGKLSLEAALEIFIPIAQALAYAHNQGIIHRDLKPSNVMLATDESGFGPFIPKIVDFGIAKIQSADDGRAMTLTATGDVFGTPLYMSPEQCAGSAIDARTDIYSLGCMLFEALTGAPPFRGRNALEIMMQHGTGTVPSLKEASLGGVFPRQIERIISSTLAKDPNQRYSNCQKLADDLVAFQQGDLDRMSTISQIGAVPLSEPKKGYPLIYIGVMALAFICTGAMLGFFLATLHSVSPQLPSKQEESVASTFTATSYLGVTDESVLYSYFSQPKDGNLVFNFPWQNPRGTFYHWNDNRINQFPANKTQSVPCGTKLIFVPSGNFFRQPDLWARFRPNELYGVVLEDARWMVLPETLNQAVRIMADQDKLRVLSLEDKSLSSRAWRSISDIPHLLWLTIVACQVEGKGISGEQVADLKYLRDLHLLKLSGVRAATPFLKKLAEGSGLRRLSLSRTTLTDDDIKLISKIRTLEVLSLRGISFSADPIEDIAKLKRLKTMIVDIRLLQSAAPENLRKLHGIKLLVNVNHHREGERHRHGEHHRDDTDVFGSERDKDDKIVAARSFDPLASKEWKKVVGNLSDCTVEELEQPDRWHSAPENLFDPLKVNPADIDI